MRYVTVTTSEGERLGRVADEDTVELLDTESGLAELLTHGEDPASISTNGQVPYDPATLGPPVRPGKIVCIGLNYMKHVTESGAEVPKAPLIFSKWPSTVIGPRADVVVNRAVTDQVDWEAELALVVGSRMRHVPAEDAYDHVFGYTVANDVSGRDAQLGDGQWVRGKSFDTFCPIGPAIVTPEEIADPQDLRIGCWVNGEEVQSGSTDDMVFGIREILSYCSASFTLEPGDLVLTGTPWGVGVARDPQWFLAAGDVLETEVAGLGRIANRITDE